MTNKFRVGLCLLASLLTLNGAPAEEDTKTSASVDFVPTVTEYLNLLAAGDYDAAVEMSDFDGLAEHLLQQRLIVLRQGKKPMTPEEEEVLIRGMRERELSRDNLKKVLTQILEEMDPKGMAWTIMKTGQSPITPSGLIVVYEVRKPERPTFRSQVGLVKKLGKWIIAPQIVEQMTARPTGARKVDAPAFATRLADEFWTGWKSGNPNASYALFSSQMQTMVTTNKFKETVDGLLQERGSLNTWKINSCIELQTNLLNIIFELDFIKGNTKALLSLFDEEGTWKVSGFALPYNGP